MWVVRTVVDDFADEKRREDCVQREHEEHRLGVGVREGRVDDLLALLERIRACNTRATCHAPRRVTPPIA